ncbi:AAA family ATPase, partial [Desulfobulbus sp. N3]|nr:AAA family ATPase [Desulfobulbus sp. N3]
VLYSEAHYPTIVRNKGYFVDKTQYVQRLESVANPVFLRPRRFGKTLLCSILRHYYDLNSADEFEELFGHTWIGQNPTGNQNSCIILSLNFSLIELAKDVEKIEENFRRYCNIMLASLGSQYTTLLGDMPKIDSERSATENLVGLLQYIYAQQLPPLYIIIDEYDNFANQLVVSHQDRLYRELTADDGFMKTFFKAMKAGRENSTIRNVFITGVLPITMDDMASGFNVANFLTLHPRFEHMLGFTQKEIDELLDAVYQDYGIDPATRQEVGAVVKNHYNATPLLRPAERECITPPR